MKLWHEYAAHAKSLADRWQIEMVTNSRLPPDEAHAEVDERRIVHSPIVDDVSYIVSLHEMGHIVHANGFLRRDMPHGDAESRARLMLVEEEAAWEWAHANALDGDWTVGMEQTRQLAMNTYTQSLEAAKGGELPLRTLADALNEMFGLGGVPMPPPRPPVAYDATAATRRQQVYRGLAQTVIVAIKETNRG